MNVVVHKLANAPTKPTAGQLYYNTVENRLFYYNGTEWEGSDSLDAAMTGADIVQAINGSDKVILDARLSQAVRDAITKSHNSHTIADIANLQTALDGKVAKEAGKGLSTNDYTTAEKNKLGAIKPGATKTEGSTVNGNVKIDGAETIVYTHPSGANPHNITATTIGLGNVDNTSDLLKPVSTAVQAELDLKLNISDRYTKVSDLDNDLGFVNSSDLAAFGAGDMLKSVYDQDDDGIVDNAKKVNGFTVAKDVPANANFENTIYVLPEATKTILGGVKEGAGLTINTSGVVSVNDNGHKHTIANVTGLEAALAAKETPAGATAKATAAEDRAKGYTDTKITELIGAAPDMLDTFAEIAQALGDDPNFATTMIDLLATKTNKYTKLLDGTTSQEITHNLNSRDLAVTIRQTGAPYAQVITDVEFTTVNTATVKFAIAPPTGEYTITLVG